MGDSDCSASAKYAEEADLPYDSYPYTGGLSFFFTFGLFLLFLCIKRLRIHPNGIIIHLLFALSMMSLVTLVDGFSYIIR